MLTWEQKKVIIFLFSIVGSFKQKAYWKEFMIFDKQQRNINAIIENCESLLVDMKFDDKDYDILAKDIVTGVYRIECLHTRELEDRRRTARKNPVTVKEDDLFDLVYYAMEDKCNNCTRNPKRRGLRKTLKKSKIVEVDPDKTEGCEFLVKRGMKSC